MRRSWLFVPLLAMSGVLTGVAGQAPDVAVAQRSPVTFNKDVLPMLQKNCQSCHRPGEIAPMSFLTYESTRPWAKSDQVGRAQPKRCRRGLRTLSTDASLTTEA